MVGWFIDSHAHASTLGLGYGEVVRRFRAAGGRLIVLVQLPPSSYGYSTDLDGVGRSLNIHTNACAEVKKELGGVLCFVGIHPATVDRLVRSSRGADLVYHELLASYMKVIENLLREGLADGLGEFGRPHYSSPPESFVVNELLLVESMKLAKDYDVPIHIHSENAGFITLESIKVFTNLTGLPRSRVLVHHVPPSQARLYTEAGFYVSVVGRTEVVKELGDSCSNVLVESDYLDDPKRPGAVTYPWSLGPEVMGAVKAGLLEEACAERILQVNPASFYGLPE